MNTFETCGEEATNNDFMRCDKFDPLALLLFEPIHQTARLLELLQII